MIHHGICRLTLRASYVRSLKDKRSLVQSMKHRLRAQFNLAVAEVESLDTHTIIVLALASTYNHRSMVESEIHKAVEYIQRHFDVEVIDEEIYVDTI